MLVRCETNISHGRRDYEAIRKNQQFKIVCEKIIPYVTLKRMGYDELPLHRYLPLSRDKD